MNENLTTEEADAAWAFLYRNRTEWVRYLQTRWTYSKQASDSLTCTTLNKLSNLIDKNHENHNRP